MSSLVRHRAHSSIQSHSFTPAPPHQWKYKYDVFLSFRGEDTRDNFVDHLYTELRRKGIHTFKDDQRLQRGEVIAPELSKAAEESRFSVVVLSTNYASSRWCLNELVKILECNPTTTTVYPVFYHVDPSQVRNQTGDFGKGFEELVSKNDTIEIHEVQRWRKALNQIANLSGWPYPTPTIIRSESKFIQELVGEIFSKLDRAYSRVTEYLVGMDSRVENVIELLGLGLYDCDEARVVGIWGMGGIGKTTLARAVCDRISLQFEGCSFLENVRENSKKERGLEIMQEKLIYDILMEDGFKVRDIYQGITMIKNMISSKKVLIVLDDVDSSIELEKLVGEFTWFHRKSRIIVTTRDLHKVITVGVRHIYKVEELKRVEAIELFISKAFGKHQPMRGYEKVLDHAVEYAKGVPLAVKVLGSFLKGRSTGEWESALRRLKESPDEEVERVLKISYDALGREDKKIFLDIACFFKGKDINDISKILDSCGFNPGIGINVLVEKSLVTISECNKLLMHDLIQQLGWHIVHQECPQEPGERSRLWLHEDIEHVLEDNTGTNKVEGIVVDYPVPEGKDPKYFRHLEPLRLSSKVFVKMANLRILKICCWHISDDLKYLSNKLRSLDWCGYPLKYLPSTFQPEHLVDIHITYSSIEHLWKGAMPLHKLRIMNLSHSTYLFKTPNFAEVPNLERLILNGCKGLVELHPSIGDLRRLTYLNLKDCKNLKSLPIGIHLESLEILIVSGCSKLKTILGSFECMERLSKLYLDGTSIEELPPSVVHLTNLRLMNLRDCKNLRSIPNHIGLLKALTTLILSGCSKLDKLPEDLGVLDRLRVLHADRTAIRKFPSSIVLLEKLEILSFHGCGGTASNSWSSILSSLFLRRRRENSTSLELPDLSRFKNLRELYLGYCNLNYLPSDICSLHSLIFLDLRGNLFESLPARINQLELIQIWLVDCKRLKELPELSSEIKVIIATDCESLRTILNPSIYQNVIYIDFGNCFELAENEQSNNLQDIFLLNQFQDGMRERFAFTIAGSEISGCFSHQSMGATVSIHLPPHWYNPRFLGFAFSAAVILKKRNFSTLGISLHSGDRKIADPLLYSFVARSPVVWIRYMQFDSKWFEDFELEQFNEFGIDITVSFFEEVHSGNIPNASFIKSGVRLIYMEDDDDDDDGDDQASSVYSSADINDRSVGEETANKSKRSWDDLNDYKAGPSGNGSFQEDHLNSKRLRKAIDSVDHLNLNH